MAQSNGLILNTDENYQLITRARCIIINSLSARNPIDNYEYLSGISILTSSNDLRIQCCRKATNSFNHCFSSQPVPIRFTEKKGKLL